MLLVVVRRNFSVRGIDAGGIEAASSVRRTRPSTMAERVAIAAPEKSASTFGNPSWLIRATFSGRTTASVPLGVTLRTSSA